MYCIILHPHANGQLIATYGDQIKCKVFESNEDSSEDVQTAIDDGIEVQEDKSDPDWWYLIMASVLLIGGFCAYPIIICRQKPKGTDDSDDEAKAMRTQRVTSTSVTGENEVFINGTKNEGDDIDGGDSKV